MQSDKPKKIEVLIPPAVGYSFNILLRFLFRYGISLRYFHRIVILGLINLINLPFRSYERWFINPRFKKQEISTPVFIIGHWRSGTTHLHNLLCCDPRMGFVTTYQGVFPDTLFNKVGRFIFKSFTSLLIPSTRKGDNVKLDPNNPQEEEFALGDKTPACFYYFWMFPRDTSYFYERFIRFNGTKPITLEAWKNDYRLLINKALKNTCGKTFLSKNPPNTGRVKVLLEMFPDAKFIYIHRNPVEVYLSTRNFFEKMMPPLQLQTIDEAEMDNNILTVYKDILSDYADQKRLIPSGNLIEVRFSDLEEKPMEMVEQIYDQLKLPGFDEARQEFVDYIKQMKNYRKNEHTIHRSKLGVILKEWDFAMKNYNYSVPDNIRIEND